MATARKILVLLLLGALLLGAGWYGWQRATMVPPLRIGALHALTGSMAVNERPLVDALRLAVEEINAQGGVLGRPLELLVSDTQSNPEQAARQAQRLIREDKVGALFGCWTSSCRKALLPVLEEHKHLLFYPLQYEGMEQSPYVVYTGAAPNQQIVPGVRWALEHLGKRVYLLGSDYVFPRTANLIVRDLVVADAKAAVLGERYVPIGGGDMAAVMDDIRRLQPDVLISTLNGDSNAAFFEALVAAGLQEMPLLSFSVDEGGVQAWGGARLRQHYAVWSYFQSLPDEDNQRFVADFQNRFGPQRVTSDSLVASYVGVRLWAQAVRAAGTEKPALVNEVLMRQSLRGPGGIFAVDGVSRHLWRTVRLGRVGADGQFEQVFASPWPLQPKPWPGYRLRSDWRELLRREGVQ